MQLFFVEKMSESVALEKILKFFQQNISVFVILPIISSPEPKAHR